MKKPKSKTIILRGCKVRVPISMSAALELAERNLTRADWQSNHVAE